MDQSQLIKGFLQEELLIFDKYLRDSVKSNNHRLIDMTSYVLNSNGKRLRPTLVLLTARACGKIIPETYHGAATVELLHTATLIHDDVIDESDFRRGKRSLNAIYDNTSAILIGDFLLSTALAESVKTKNLEIVRIISELGKNLADGELLQFNLAKDIIISESDYFDVIDKKTASLLSASLAIGAITGGANEELISQFVKVGKLLGISFQLKDDIFDYYSDDVGKPTGNDIREGKVTLPLIYALNNAPKDVSDGMMEIIKTRNYSDENIQLLLRFAKDYKGVEYTYKKMDALLAESEEIISSFSFDKDIKMYMTLFLTYLRERSF
ncbi:MAG TPA: polyprenyl synthetase family protein [Fermentimonas sp.]|nr:polyprenyl synthetase family protein [Fermentimonas sp.]